MDEIQWVVNAFNSLLHDGENVCSWIGRGQEALRHEKVGLASNEEL